MTVTATPLRSDFGVSLSGFSIADGVSPDDMQQIKAAFEKWSLVVFPNQPMLPAMHVAFSSDFGELEVALTKLSNDDVGRQIALLTNVDANDRIVPGNHRVMLNNKANSLWHTDSTFKPRTALASLLYAREVPPQGGETEFVSTRVAWNELPKAKQQQVESLWAVHDFGHSRGKVAADLIPDDVKALTPLQRRPLVRVNPVTGEKSLYVASHACAIEGMPDDEAQDLLAELIEFCTAPSRVLAHTWSAGDLVMWDNRATMHRGRPWKDEQHRRVMHRTTVIDPEILDANYGDESRYQQAHARWADKTAQDQTAST